MKKEIESQLSVLLGIPLESAGRAANLMWFCFGREISIRDRNGNERAVNEYALHVQCSWRLTRKTKIFVASNDIYVPSSQWEGSEDDFDWDVQGMNLCDERMQEFNARRQLLILVESIEADCFGGVRIHFTEEYVLELFPSASFEVENWRFFTNIDEECPHFVVTSQGIEE